MIFDIRVSERDLATILAALRHWQNLMDVYVCVPSEHFSDDCPALTADEIDDLCERINCDSH